MSQQINLLNPALRPKIDFVSPANVAWAVLASLVLVGVLGTICTARLQAFKADAAAAADQLKTFQDRVSLLTLKVASAKPDASLQSELDKLRAQIEARDAVMAAAGSGAPVPGNGYVDVLKALARRTTQGIWLTGISVSASGSLELTGRAIDRAIVAEYLRRLNEEQVLAGRSFSGMKIQVPKPDENAEGSSRRPRYLEFTLTSGSAQGEGAPGEGKKS